MAERCLRDLPGVAELERLVARDEDHPNPLWAPGGDRAARMADEIARDLFGITNEEIPAEHVNSLSDNPEAAELLAQSLDWDIGDEAGETLACFEWLMAPLIYASRGFKGVLPDPNYTASVETWAAKLTAEREKWGASHRRPAVHMQKDRSRRG